MKTELTIEQSQHLIELGVDPKRVSMTTRLDFNGTYAYVSGEESEVVRNCVNGQFYVEESEMFTLSDIIAMLPKEIDVCYDGGEVDTCILGITTHNDGWEVSYYGVDSIFFESSELIDALYELLIWCIKNKDIEL